MTRRYSVRFLCWFSFLLTGSCAETTNTNVNNGVRLSCVEHKTTDIHDDGTQLKNFLKHVSFSPEPILNRVLGEWTGTFPGTSSIDKFEFSLHIGTYQENGKNVLRFYLPLDEEQEAQWHVCSDAGIDIYVERIFTSNSDFVISSKSSEVVYLMLDGIDLAEDSDFPEDLNGVPYLIMKLLNGEPDDEGYYHMMFAAFPPSGKMFMKFWKGDNSNLPNEEAIESDWVETHLRSSPTS